MRLVLIEMGLLMMKLLAVLLFFGVSFLPADDEDFSYTYLDLSAVQADDTGYDAFEAQGPETQPNDFDPDSSQFMGFRSTPFLNLF